MSETSTPIADSIFLEQPNPSTHVYTIATTTWKPINQWISSVAKAIEEWPEDQPCRLLYDFSRIFHTRLPKQTPDAGDSDARTIGVTAEGNETILRILAAKPKLKVSLAVVLQTNISMTHTQLRASMKPAAAASDLYSTKVFGTRSGALTWLETQG